MRRQGLLYDIEQCSSESQVQVAVRSLVFALGGQFGTIIFVPGKEPAQESNFGAGGKITGPQKALVFPDDSALWDREVLGRGRFHRIDVPGFGSDADVPACYSIHRVEFSARTVHCLENGRIPTLGMITTHACNELMGIKNFGRKCLEEVVEKLRPYKLTLKCEPTCKHFA
ncbi:MAG: DNA-directed RNA polymerase subunit alpha C-terminal domain-containing protein [Patescibacteria group bacterium]